MKIKNKKSVKAETQKTVSDADNQINDSKMTSDNTENKEDTPAAEEEQSSATEETASGTGEQENNAEENETDNLSRQLAECQDKYARLSAEFDNYRKRTLREKMDLIEGGSKKAVLAILPVVDDLERAVKNIADETQKEGVELILKKMMDALKSLSVEKIEAMGLDFDVEVHNAITKFPAPSEEQKGKVIDVIKNGYRLGQEVIRHAEVVVGE